MRPFLEFSDQARTLDWRSGTTDSLSRHVEFELERADDRVDITVYQGWRPGA
jgi:hypothetical protein